MILFCRYKSRLSCQSKEMHVGSRFAIFGSRTKPFVTSFLTPFWRYIRCFELLALSSRTQANHCGSCSNGYHLSSKSCLAWVGSCLNGALNVQASRTQANHCGTCSISRTAPAKPCFPLRWWQSSLPSPLRSNGWHTFSKPMPLPQPSSLWSGCGVRSWQLPRRPNKLYYIFLCREHQ